MERGICSVLKCCMKGRIRNLLSGSLRTKSAYIVCSVCIVHVLLYIFYFYGTEKYRSTKNAKDLSEY